LVVVEVDVEFHAAPWWWCQGQQRRIIELEAGLRETRAKLEGSEIRQAEVQRSLTEAEAELENNTGAPVFINSRT
jgi:hypothetical protein